MARSGPQWSMFFGEQNNGQDNAQWIIVDYNNFSPGGGVPDNTVLIVETIPGMVQKTDVSPQVDSSGYFASYNRPMGAAVRDATGHTAAEAFYGKLYSYGANPRAEIFASFASGIQNLFTIRNLMRRNEYPNEGVKPNEPGHPIAARNDLDMINLLPNGAIDAKVTNRCLFRSLQCQAISGPTHDSQPVFKWKDGAVDVMAGWPHMGQPDVYDFDWVQMTPTKQLDSIV